MAIVYDIDGDGSADPFSDGLMILRYVLGVRGDDLIEMTIAFGAVRTTSYEIEGYLDGIRHTLDADGNGLVEIGDALLILYRMIGLSGINLTNGNISGGATRYTAAAIQDYIDRLCADI